MANGKAIGCSPIYVGSIPTGEIKLFHKFNIFFAFEFTISCEKNQTIF